jgi:hypothetical protein
MAIVEVEFNQDQLRDVRERLDYIANGAVKAMFRALNKTANKARTIGSQEIRKQVNLSAAKVKEKLKCPSDGFAYKANSGSLVSRVSAESRGLRMDNFLVSLFPYRSGRPTDPIRVKVKPSGAAKTVWDAFWVKAKNSGGYLIVMRNEILRAQGMKTSLGRLPYTALQGPSVSQVFNTVRTDIGATMNAYLAEKLDAETAWLIRRNPPPPGDGSDEE